MSRRRYSFFMSGKWYPYLSSSQRLPHVVAAIQILSEQLPASRHVRDWEEKLGKTHDDTEWEEIFKEHPEFFRFNPDGYVSVRWRHAYDRTFSPRERRELSTAEIQNLSETGLQKLERKPLSGDQVELLLTTAVEMHARQVAHAQERRWLIPLLFALVGVIIGAVLKGH